MVVDPHDHPGDHRDGNQADDRLELLLLPLWQLLGREVETDAARGTEHDRADDPDPHPAERLRLLALAEERGHDADDQCGFETLPQADHEGGQHLDAPPVNPGKAHLSKGNQPCAPAHPLRTPET